ncbi:MAG: acetyl-CoA C-acyltransferase [Actinomycetota bacterium]
MPEAVIVSTARTPIGRAGKGSLIDVRPDDLGGFAIKQALAKVPNLDPNEVEDVMVGCGFPEEEQGMNLGRRVADLAGMPEVPGTTVNRFCASSLQTIRMAFHAIKAGEGDVYVAAGIESISRVPQVPRGATEGDFSAFHPGQGGTDFTRFYMPMGITAANVAERFNVSREDMDRFGKRSQDNAVAAQERGFFDWEISPYTKADGTTVSKDDGPRAGTTLEKLAELKPVFGDKITAGNACPLNDGAAAVVVMSEERAKQLNITPLARIVASSVTGLDPEIMGVGPIEAIRKVLKQANMTTDDIDQFELNEAFAAQVIASFREVGVDPFDARVNPNGGAIALGHPYGMTGARIMGTLINGLRENDKRFGLETMCVGGGQGMAMIIERL